MNRIRFFRFCCPVSTTCLLHAVSLYACLLPASQVFSQTTLDSVSAIADLTSEFENVRTSAFDSLKRQGIRIHNLLMQNRNSNDVEQKMAVDRLLRQCQIDWTDVALSESTLQLLTHYPSLSEARRKTVIGLIARNQVSETPLVLSRLAKYEPSESLSLLAALTLINDSLRSRESIMVTMKNKRLVQMELGETTRPAGQLLRLWTDVDLESFTMTWLENTARAITTRSVQTTPLQNEILARQVEIAIASLIRIRKPDLANELAIQWLQSVDHNDHLEFVLEILSDFELQKASVQFAAKFKEQIENNPLLAYGLANFYSKIGDPEQSAMFVALGDRIAKTHPVTGLEIGTRLKRLGYHQTAEHVFRHTIDNAHPHLIAQSRSRLLLAELLHEQKRHGQAAVVLEPLLELLRNDDSVRDTLGSKIGLQLDQVAARQILFASLEAYAAGDMIRQSDLLLEGIINHPSDVQLLIEAHQCFGLNHEASPVIDRLCSLRQQELLIQITKLQTDPSSPWAKKERNRNRRIAVLCNRLAWLSVHTNNDPSFSIRFAQMANRLSPGNPCFLDTESHCWQALGNQSKAISIARQANRLLPKNLYFQRELKTLEQNSIKTAQRRVLPAKRPEK